LDAIGALIELGLRNGYRRSDLAGLLETYPT
jgi:hypothetical protein